MGKPDTRHHIGSSKKSTGVDTPPGECPQCWQHAHDRRAHRNLGPREDCPQCVDHMINGHPYTVPKKSSFWW